MSLSDQDVSPKSQLLSTQTIAFGICGGIGAVESIKIIRELRRHGAKVIPFMTPSALQFLTTLSVEWAAQNKAVLHSTEDVEHLQSFRAVVVAPCTLNSLAKMALGLADNAVTSLLATQFARRAKVLLIPAMNEAMSQHPLYQNHTSILKSWGAAFLEETPEEGRLKMPSPEKVTHKLLEMLTSR